MSRIRPIIPACISGAADWLLKRSARNDPQQAATAAIAATIAKQISIPSRPGQSAPRASAMTKTKMPGIRARALAASTVPASSTQRGAGETSSRSTQPAS